MVLSESRNNNKGVNCKEESQHRKWNIDSENPRGGNENDFKLGCKPM